MIAISVVSMLNLLECGVLKNRLGVTFDVWYLFIRTQEMYKFGFRDVNVCKSVKLYLGNKCQ